MHSSLDLIWLIVVVALLVLMQAGALCRERTSIYAQQYGVVTMIPLIFFVACIFYIAVGAHIIHGDTQYGFIGLGGFSFFEKWDFSTLTYWLMEILLCISIVVIAIRTLKNRVGVPGFLLITMITAGLAYPFIIHWAWQGGDTASQGWLKQMGFIDTAGSTLIHSSAGWVALAALLAIAPRPYPLCEEYFNAFARKTRHSFLNYACLVSLMGGALGLLLLRATALSAWDIVFYAITSVVVGMLTVATIIWFRTHWLSWFNILNGGTAGLVAISASIEYASFISTVLISIGAGVMMFYTSRLLHKLKIKDLCHVIPIHLTPGIWGTLVVPCVAANSFPDLTVMFGVQLLGVLACGAWVFGFSLMILMIVFRVIRPLCGAEELMPSTTLLENDLHELLHVMHVHAEDEDFEVPLPKVSHPECKTIAKNYSMVLEKLQDVQNTLEGQCQGNEEANATRLAFLRNTSHELRTPMNGIVGVADLLLDTSLTEEQLEYVNAVRSSASSLLHIVSDILDCCKIEAGELYVESLPFDLHHEASDVVALLRPMAQKKGLELVLDYAKDLPHYVIGDPTKVRQILTNILVNSIKFTEQGRVSVHAIQESCEDQTLSVTFNIIDTGVGIPDGKIRAILEHFSKVGENPLEEQEGLGLGLTICKVLIRALGGHIHITSQLEKGTTVSITLTLKVNTSKHEVAVQSDDNDSADHKAKAVISSLASISPKTSKKADKNRDNALIVEDQYINRILAEKLLERLGYQKVFLAENGKEALDLMKENQFDMVLMDCQMPVMDGYESTRLYREWEKEQGDERHTAIIAMTAHALIGDRERCLSIGMDEYISKPINLDKVQSVIEEYEQSLLTESTPEVIEEPEVEEVPIVDMNQLQLFTGGSKDLEKEILKFFLEAYLGNMKKLHESKEDGKVWKTFAHTLRGSCANVGASVLAALYKEAEQNYDMPLEKKIAILEKMEEQKDVLLDYLGYQEDELMDSDDES